MKSDDARTIIEHFFAMSTELKNLTRSQYRSLYSSENLHHVSLLPVPLNSQGANLYIFFQFRNYPAKFALNSSSLTWPQWHWMESIITIFTVCSMWLDSVRTDPNHKNKQIPKWYLTVLKPPSVSDTRYQGVARGMFHQSISLVIQI